MKHTPTARTRPVRRRPDKRHNRPYVAALVRQYQQALGTLVDELARMEGAVYNDDDWRAMLTRVHTLRSEVDDLRWRIFRAVGFNMAILRRLERRV